MYFSTILYQITSETYSHKRTLQNFLLCEFNCMCLYIMLHIAIFHGRILCNEASNNTWYFFNGLCANCLQKHLPVYSSSI